MCGVESDVIFDGKLELTMQRTGDRLQARPKHSVMNKEKIDFLFSRGL